METSALDPNSTLDYTMAGQFQTILNKMMKFPINLASHKKKINKHDADEEYKMDVNVFMSTLINSGHQFCVRRPAWEKK